MPRITKLGTAVAATAAAAAFGVPAMASASASAPAPADKFHQANLISDRTDQGAQVVDPNLQNSWGLALGQTGPLWVADNHTSLATTYTIGQGGVTAAGPGLTVTVPPADSSPTGQMANPTSDFVVTTDKGSGPAAFLFSTEGGQIVAWNPAADPIGAGGTSTATTEFPPAGAHTSPNHAIYKGLAIASVKSANYLYATDFHNGKVDVFDKSFKPAHLPGNFRDPFLPKGYAPFGIESAGGYLYITYAQQDANREDDVQGPGKGFIDVYTPAGYLVKRLVSRGDLNAPWGMAVAPAGFGPFGGKLLVGNFGSGQIHAYDPVAGREAGTLLNEKHKPISVEDLWDLQFGTAATGGTGTLLFSAGPNDEADGLVGAITYAP